MHNWNFPNRLTFLKYKSMIRIIIEIDQDQITLKKLPDVIQNTDEFRVLKKSVIKNNIKEDKKIKIDPKLKVKICAKCGKEFEPVSNGQKYCSLDCGMKPNWYNKKRKNKSVHLSDTLITTSVKNCERCGNEYTPKGNAQKYCSNKCKQLDREEKDVKIIKHDHGPIRDEVFSINPQEIEKSQPKEYSSF